MNISREEYETAIKNSLSHLHQDNGGYLMSLEGYAGQFDREDALQLWMGRFPAVLILLGEATFPETTTCFWKEELILNVIIGARSWRSQGESRGDMVGQASISSMFIDVRAAMLGKTLDLVTDDGCPAIRPIELIRETIIESDLSTVVGGAEYLITNDRVMEVL
jgi:phage gp37-like protein